jgi:hypothetical protein
MSKRQHSEPRTIAWTPALFLVAVALEGIVVQQLGSLAFALASSNCGIELSLMPYVAAAQRLVSVALGGVLIAMGLVLIGRDQ